LFSFLEKATEEWGWGRDLGEGERGVKFVVDTASKTTAGNPILNL
jgi:hypothetical protein